MTDRDAVLTAISLAGGLLAVPLGAQAPPATDIHLVDLGRDAGAWKLGTPRKLTDRDGYDNQPSFSADGRLLYYTSYRDGQTDIWSLELEGGDARAVTSTAESEYSPTVVPDGEALSVVRVEADGTQRLWRWPLDGGDPTPIAPEVTGVGYHAWLGGRRLGLFVLGDPMTLQVLELDGGERSVVVDAPGRSLHRIPASGRLGFVAPDGDGHALFAFDPASGETERLAPAPGSEQSDHCWTPDGVALAAVGTRIYRLRPGVDSDWIEIGDLGGAGIGTITRMAVAPAGDRIALVADRIDP